MYQGLHPPSQLIRSHVLQACSIITLRNFMIRVFFFAHFFIAPELAFVITASGQIRILSEIWIQTWQKIFRCHMLACSELFKSLLLRKVVFTEKTNYPITSWWWWSRPFWKKIVMGRILCKLPNTAEIILYIWEVSGLIHSLSSYPDSFLVNFLSFKGKLLVP